MYKILFLYEFNGIVYIVEEVVVVESFKNACLNRMMNTRWGGTPLYGLYRYVRPQRVFFFSRFGHK